MSDKAKVFFDRAVELFHVRNWNFAIDMLLEGLKIDPSNIDLGFEQLYQVALKRKQGGGKGASWGTLFKLREKKNIKENLINAANLMALDPGNILYMIRIFRFANKLGFSNVVTWSGKILIDFFRNQKKPKKLLLSEIILSLSQIKDEESYEIARSMCVIMSKAYPNDGDIARLTRQIEAERTIKKGKYEEEGDFTKGVLDMEAQQKLMQEGSNIKSKVYLQQRVEETGKEYKESSITPGKIHAHVEALLKLETQEAEDKAISVLLKADEESKSYEFRQKMGDIRITRMRRKYRELVDAGKKDEAIEQASKQLDYELKEYRDRIEHYPTDLKLKFELGKRQFLKGLYDEAIVNLQASANDPKKSVDANILIGRCFYKKEWYPNAIGIFKKVLDRELTEKVSKEIYYLLGLTQEAVQDYDGAIESYSVVAQMDFSYKNISDKISALRENKPEK